MKSPSEATLEIAIEAVLLADGYTRVDGKGFGPKPAVLPGEALDSIRAAQGKLWEKLDTRHGEQSGSRVLELPCTWLDVCGALAAERHGAKGFAKTKHSSGAPKQRLDASVTAAVTGQIPREATGA